MATMTTTPQFAAPGPGSWSMDAGHFPRAVFGVFQRIFPAGFDRGFRDCCKRYGMLMDTMDVKFVHGFPYLQPRIVGAPPAGGKPPPRPVFFVVFKLLTALHPEIRARMAIAKDIFERRPWRDEVRQWDERVRLQTVAAHRAIADVDLAALDDAALARHLVVLEEHATRMAAQDHSYNLTFMVPLGDFLARTRAWSGLEVAELMALLRGHSAISSGDCAERRRLLAALRGDAAARALLESALPAAQICERLRAHPGEVGAAMRDWCLIVGNALAHGLDLATATVNEDPAPALQGLRAALTERAAPARDDDAAARVRARVPEAKRAEFDVLLDDARLTYRLRDERHLYGAMPTLGLVRRVLLEAGRRLQARGALEEARHALFCDAAELGAMLEGRAQAPTDVAERVRIFETLPGKDVPALLGPPPSPPPPLAWLPNEGARRLMVALDLYLGDMVEAAPPTKAPTAIEGLAVSRGVVEGTARVCRSADDLNRVQQGDILIAPLTSPAINIVLPVLGGIVTDKGGALSHAAIVSREYGIPGVVGTRDATTRIKDGARVRVDGDRGTVSVLA